MSLNSFVTPYAVDVAGIPSILKSSAPLYVVMKKDVLIVFMSIVQTQPAFVLIQKDSFHGSKMIYSLKTWLAYSY